MTAPSNRALLCFAIVGIVLTLAGFVAAQRPQSAPATPAASAEAPRYDGDGKLIAPANYREWVFLGAGLGMTYNEPPAGNADTPRRQNFTNVFVNPSAYRAFMQTGTWPDQTTLVLEIRGSETAGSINKGGNYQGPVRALEIEVKDEKKFPGKWGFFDIDMSNNKGAQLPPAQSCYSCHAQHGAVDNTFVQFYPILADVAKQKGTFRESPALK